MKNRVFWAAITLAAVLTVSGPVTAWEMGDEEIIELETDYEPEPQPGEATVFANDFPEDPETDDLEQEEQILEEWIDMPEEPAQSDDLIFDQVDNGSSLSTLGDEQGKAADSFGDCGANGGDVVWEIRGGGLFLSGNGRMRSYDAALLPPWHDDASITWIVVGDGVKNVGAYAFVGCGNVTDVELPRDIEEIGPEAFVGCRADLRLTLR